MDAKDRQIVAALQKDGRLTNLELAERVNLSPSPCLRRVRILEDRDIIKGYTALVDEAAYGLPVTAFVRVRLDRHHRDVVEAFEARVRAIDAVLDCYVMTGDADYLLRVLVDSLQGYERFVRQHLHQIEGVAELNTSFAFGVVKRSMLFPSVS